MNEVINHWDRSLAKMLSDADLRIFLMRLIKEDCQIDRESFSTNAETYCLLAKQQIGKRLLRSMKSVDADLTCLAEKEYDALILSAYEKIQKELENE